MFDKIFFREDETYICEECLLTLKFDKQGTLSKTCEIWEENSCGWNKKINCSRCYTNIPVICIEQKN